MKRIKRLFPTVINLITAGEVVEHQAAVVKELVENSLDANAGQIKMEIKASGCSLIRVANDGVRIAPQDLVLALQDYILLNLLCFLSLREHIGQIFALTLKPRAKTNQNGKISSFNNLYKLTTSPFL
jgi:hypothetical protein